MTARELSTIAKSLTHILPEFTIGGPLIFKTTPPGILLGLHCGQSSRDSRILRLNAFFLPLFVPTDVIHFNYGKRISSISGQWNADSPNLINDLIEAIRVEAIPFLQKVSTLTGALNYLKASVESNGQSVNPHTLEALAYTLIESGEYPSAMKVLVEQKQLLEGATVPWMIELKARAQLIEERLSESPETALAQLEAWKEETKRKLKLDKYS